MTGGWSVFWEPTTEKEVSQHNAQQKGQEEAMLQWLMGKGTHLTCQSLNIVLMRIASPVRQ